MQDKVIHIVGGGYNQLPIVRLAKSMGLKVVVTDMYDNPPCKALADVFEKVDTTDKENTLNVCGYYRPI
jgi:phosphoribosylaminoimidazole carboxylase (NCAIR synthetase)